MEVVEKQASKSIARRVAEAIPFVAFFASLFFFENWAFDVSDALLGIVFLFFAHTMVYEPGLAKRNYALRCAWFFLMSLCSTLAGLHPVAMIAGTGVYMFVVTVVNSDDYLPRNHFWLGLGFLMLMVYPVGVDGIGTRILATLFTIAVTTVFVYVMRRIFLRMGELDVFKRDRAYMRRGFDSVGTQLTELAEGDLERLNRHELFELAQSYATLEYGTVFRQNGLLSGRQGYTFALLLCMEQVVYNIKAAANNYSKFDETEKAYYLDLAKLFFGFGEGRISTVHQMADEIEDFLSTRKLNVPEHDESWRAILETTMRTLRDTRLAKDTSTPFLKSLGYRLYYLRDNVSLRNTQTRFALQLACVVTLAQTVNVLLTAYADAMFGIWIPMVAFTIVNTYSDETLKSTGRNIVGTLIGVAIFVLLVNLVPLEARVVVAVFLGYTIILTEIGRMWNVAGGTQMALSALYPYATLGTAASTRLMLVLIGALCVVTLIFFVMNTRRSETVRAKLVEMERIDVRLMKSVRKGLERGYVNLWRTVQLLYYTHLDAGLLQRLSSSLAESKVKLAERKSRKPADQQLAADVQRVLDLNYRFTMDAAHAVVLLDPRRRQENRWRSGSVYPDTTGRLRHLDVTAEKLDAELHSLEGMRHLEQGD